MSMRAAVMAMCSLMVSSCAALNVNSLPLPGSTYEGGYDIVAEFVNVLNLPDRAKVVMDGTTVGTVTGVSIAGDHVDVTARIQPGVQVPSTAEAVLQQATVLGDIYLAIERPETASAAEFLESGGRIPVKQTTSPPQLEDTIANLANFIGSGSIQRAQNTIMNINKVTPPTDEVRRVVSRVTTDLRDLSDNIDTVDSLINGVSETASVLANRTPTLAHWFSTDGIDGFKRNAVLADTLGVILPSLGSIYNGGFWLVPALGSLATAFESVQGTKQALEREYPLYRQFINEYLLPQDKYPAINITSIVGPDGRELSGNAEEVLRMLGAMP